MDWILIVLLILLAGPLAVWLFSRLIFAAFFKSKQQYEDYRNGQRTQPGP